MRRPRFRMASMMALVVVAAAGLFAHRNWPEAWPEPDLWPALGLVQVSRHYFAAIGVLIALNLGAVAVAVAAKGRARRAAAGFALAGSSFAWFSATFPAVGVVYEAIACYEPCSRRIYEAQFYLWIGDTPRMTLKNPTFFTGPSVRKTRRSISADLSLAMTCIATIASGVAGALIAPWLFREAEAPGPAAIPTADHP